MSFYAIIQVGVNFRYLTKVENRHRGRGRKKCRQPVQWHWDLTWNLHAAWVFVDPMEAAKIARRYLTKHFGPADEHHRAEVWATEHVAPDGSFMTRTVVWPPSDDIVGAVARLATAEPGPEQAPLLAGARFKQADKSYFGRALVEPL